MQAFQKELDGESVTTMPFAMASTHMMMAKGQLNDKDDLTYFVDSGLATKVGAAFTAPIQTMDYVGIPVPQTEEQFGLGGGANNEYETGHFTIEELRLGDLVQPDSLGVYGSSTPEGYWALGFIEDGLISHNFLRHYNSWTLDFADMVYYFAE